MTNPPTGRLLRTATGSDLVLYRTFRATPADVWASVTEPDRTARWFGPWKGDAGPGRTIQLQMAYEDGEPWFDVRIDACEPPRRLAVSTVDEAGSWRLELQIEATAAGTTELRLVHHLDSAAGVADFGPGWEYYLDMLVAAREGSPPPSFDDYPPAMTAHYEGLRDSA
jgi:uncharacterized protein YndB with AHSA1/START domain